MLYTKSLFMIEYLYIFYSIFRDKEGCIVALIVKKFGGSSVASPEKIYNVVNRVLRDKQPEDRVVVVVSAMGDTTDDLVSLARAVTSRPFGREMDRLLSTGEQVSIALVAMAFMEKGNRPFP